MRALGVALEPDLSRYLTFPRLKPGDRKKALARALKKGEMVETKIKGVSGRAFILAEDLAELDRLKPARGTTLICPFDSLMWHRDRVGALFGFDYRIEVYTPSSKRTYGYYSLPIFHDGRFVGRLDPKNHRDKSLLEIRRVHFEAKPDARMIKGLAGAIRFLARFTTAGQISVPEGALREVLG